MEQFFIFGGLFDYYDNMFADVLSLPNCHYRNEKTDIKNGVLKFLYKVHGSGIANKFFSLPGKQLWYRHFFDMQAAAKNAGGGTTILFLMIQTPMYIIRNFCSI